MESVITIERQLNEDLSRYNKTQESNRVHVDHKNFKFLKHVTSQGTHNMQSTITAYDNNRVQYMQYTILNIQY